MARRLTGKMMKEIVANINDAALGIDKDGKIIVYNDIAVNLLDFETTDIKGKKIWDVMEINDLTRELSAFVRNSDAVPVEQIFPMNQDRVFQAKMIPIRDSDDRMAGAVAIIDDLTDMHKMEVTVNEFVTHVSHELKTPLTSIKGFVETLLEGALNNPEITRKFLQVINDETNRMVRLVIGLLDLTRVMRENGESHVIRPVNTSRFIREAVKLFEPVATEKQIKLINSVPDNLPTIKVDTDKLRQVLINLIDNAIKYTGIRDRERKVEIKAATDGDFIRVDVIDTGVGIPKNQVDKIFQKFYRVTEGPASQLGGTGLGLSITREIVQGHGGKISVESIPDEGSKFSFTIPLAGEDEQS